MEKSTYLDVAIAAAKAAGSVQRQRLAGDFEVSLKGEIDLVTEVDRASEEIIISKLKKAFPDHCFLAEERGAEGECASHKWIIDPLDGTTNFAHGFPWFCVSIALEVAGEIHLGVVYHPMMDQLFTAVRGGGAFVNGQRIQVSPRQPLRSSLLATGFPYDVATSNENNFGHFFRFQVAARGIRRAGAAALDLAYVALGRLDGYWECKLKPWDVAAGTLLVTEAGGKVTNHAGEPHSVYDHRIAASNGLIHHEMLEVLNREPMEMKL